MRHRRDADAVEPGELSSKPRSRATITTTGDDGGLHADREAR